MGYGASRGKAKFDLAKFIRIVDFMLVSLKTVKRVCASCHKILTSVIGTIFCIVILF